MIYLLLEADFRLAKQLIREIMDLGYEAVWSQHPEDAQRLLQQETFDLVVLALSAREPLALETLAWLRAHRQKLPVLVLLEDAHPADRSVVLGAGAHAYLIKPFPPHAFREQVRTLLRQFSGRRDTAEEPPDQARGVTDSM